MAGETDTERLVVLLEARLTDFERNMMKASGVSRRRFNEVTRNSKSASRDMEKHWSRSTAKINTMLGSIDRAIGGHGKKLVGGLVAGGVAGVIKGFQSVAASIANIRDEADKAGLSTKVFQEWKFVAEQARIPIDSIVDGFKELTIRADEFAVTGKGSAADAFKRLGMTRQEVQEKLRDPSALMLELIERTKAMKNTAAGVRIFDELFGGTGGERMVSLLQQGEGEIRNQIRAAHDLGIVIEDELIDSAIELDRKFQTITATVSTGLKVAIVEAAEALQTFIDRFRTIETRQTETLQTQLKDAERRLSDAQKAEGRLGGLLDGAVKRQIEQSQREVEGLRRILAERKLHEISPQLQSLKEGGVAPKGNRPGYVEPVEPEGSGRKRAGGGRRRSTAGSLSETYQRETESIRERTAALIQETEVLGQLNPLTNDYGYSMAKATAERELLSAAEKDGKQITPELKAEIEALAEGYAKATVNAAKLAEEQDQMVTDMEEAKELVRGVLGEFRSALEDGKITFEELGDIAMSVLDRIIDKILNQLIDAMFQVNSVGSGGGGFGGILTSLLGGLIGFKAEGGMVRGPGTGTSDSIPTMLSDGEFVVNAKATSRNRGLLEAINSGQGFAGYAAGGMVSKGAVPMPSLPRHSGINRNADKASSQNVHVTVGLSSKGLDIKPMVEDIAIEKSAQAMGKLASAVPGMAIQAQKEMQVRRYVPSRMFP